MSKAPEFIKRSFFDKKQIIFYLIPLLLVVIFAQIAMKPKKTTELRSKAQAVDSIYILPATATVGSTTPTVLQVRLNVGTKFADVIGGRIVIDTTKINVAPAGVTLHTTALGGNAGRLTVQNNPAAPATINSTGFIDFAVLVNSATDIRPTGDILLLDIPVISVNTGAQNAQTQVTFHPIVTEIYAGSTLSDSSVLITLAKNSSVLTVSPATGGNSPTPTLPGASLSPTPTSTGGVSSTPTRTPTPSNTPANSPTRTPTQNPLASSTPTPTQVPVSEIAFDLRITLNGVDDGNAEGSLATVRFVKNQLDLVTPSLPLVYIGNGVYALQFSTQLSTLVPGSGYTMIIKAEKHLSRKYCKQTGQTTVCQSFETMSIAAPSVGSDPLLYDFTGLGLAPGDLTVQDGKADLSDFEKIKSRMAISCDALSDADKLIADVDYNGCVNILDAFWMRNTLETRYDEN